MGPRMTLPTQRVLKAMLTEPTKEMYCREIGQLTGLSSGTVHQIVDRLESREWLRSRWEDVDPFAEGRPRRRYCRLTPEGVQGAWVVLARARIPKLQL